MISRFIGEYRFLSNFYPARVMLPAEPAFNLPEMEFDTLENAYVASKTICLETRYKIKAMHPGAAKRFGRKKNFPLRDIYLDKSDEGIKLKDRFRLMMMIALVDSKFSNLNPTLANKLLATENLIIVEGNYHNDTFFGFCLRKNRGHNYLGNIINQKRISLDFKPFQSNAELTRTLMKIYA